MMTAKQIASHPLLADYAADSEYLASHGLRRAIVDTRTPAEIAKAKARTAALLTLAAAPAADLDHAAGWL